jgi:hypothetical protein
MPGDVAILAEDAEDVTLRQATVHGITRQGRYTRYPMPDRETLPDGYIDQGAEGTVEAVLSATEKVEVLERLEGLRGTVTVSLARPGMPLVEDLGVESITETGRLGDEIKVSIRLAPLRFARSQSVDREVTREPRADVAAGQADSVDKGTRDPQPARDVSTLRQGAEILFGGG